MSDMIVIAAPDWETFWAHLEGELHAERIDVATLPRPIRTPRQILAGWLDRELYRAKGDTSDPCVQAAQAALDRYCDAEDAAADVEWIEALSAAYDDMARDPEFAVVR